MRITMLGSGSYKSGLSIRLLALGQQLGLQGHQVTLILPAADKYNDFKPERKVSLDHVKLVQPWQLNTQSAILNLIPYLFTSVLSLVKSRPKVVLIYKPTPISVSGLLFRLVPGVKVYVDLDDLGSEVMRGEGQSNLQVKLVSFCESLSIRFSNSVIVTSTYLMSWVNKQTAGKRILRLPNGVEPSMFHTVSEKTPRSVVYYFGAINRLSLVDDLIRATAIIVRDIPDVKVLIIGDGKAVPEAKLLAKALGVTKNIDFLGWVDKTKVQKYTQFGDIGVCYQPDIPTVRAASNMKVFQYMMMASVPLVSDVGDLGAYVKNGQAGMVVKPNDYKELAKGLKDLLLHPEKRIQLANEARQLAEDKYSWKQLGLKLETFLISRKGAS